jgi:hypothetical protein
MHTLRFRVTLWALLALLSFVAASQPGAGADVVLAHDRLVERQDGEEDIPWARETA